MANLEQWVDDRLYDILGLSDRYLPLFMIGTAKKSLSSQDFVSRLQQTGAIDINEKVIAFAEELYDKVSFEFFISLHRNQKQRVTLKWMQQSSSNYVTVS